MVIQVNKIVSFMDLSIPFKVVTMNSADNCLDLSAKPIGSLDFMHVFSG